MSEVLSLSDFDIVGIIKLKDVNGIEKYVTPIYGKDDYDNPTEFFSRSKEYYNVKSLTELSSEREELRELVTREKSKRNFVILENMLNCSAKVYFKKLEQYISCPTDINRYLYEISKACLIEDSRNIIVLLSGKGLISGNRNLVLPCGHENCAKRSIEMDNKAILYLFCRELELEGDKNSIQIATPGYGSVYIGPFLKNMYGYDYTNILKSKYINEVAGEPRGRKITEQVSNNEIFSTNKKVVLLDDNIGTGTTMREIKEQLEIDGVKCYKSGAVQYNWINYYKVTVGEKTDISKFNVNEFEIISPFNYAGHKLYSHAIDILHESGNAYEEYLNSKSYRLDICCDLTGAIKRGITAARKSNLIISSKQNLVDVTKNPDDSFLRDNMDFLPRNKMEWIDGLVKSVESIDQKMNNYKYENSRGR